MTTLDPIDAYSHPVGRREYLENVAGMELVCNEGLALRLSGPKQCVIWGVPGPYAPRGFCYVEQRGGLVGIYW